MIILFYSDNLIDYVLNFLIKNNVYLHICNVYFFYDILKKIKDYHYDLKHLLLKYLF